MKDTSSTDEDEAQTTVSRRGVMKALGTAGAATVATTGSAVASGTPSGAPDSVSPAVWSDMDFTGFSPPSSLKRYGSKAHPEWVVTIASGDRASLDSWIADSQDRALRKEITTQEVVVAAPASHVIVMSRYSPLDSGTLVSKDYVRGLDYNLVHDAAVTESLQSKSEWTKPTGAQYVSLTSDGAFQASGLAFRGNSTNGTLADVKPHVGVDSVTEDGTGISVAVLDSGCNMASDSSVFGSRIKAAKNLRTGNTGVSAVEDGNGHGTWCCSSAVGADGMAPGADLLVGKVMADDGSGDTADITAGVRWAVDNGADIISMSLGSPIYSQKLQDALRYATDNGVVCLVATGNSRQTVRWVASPADVTSEVDGVIAVGAVDIAKPSEAKSAYFSQVGKDGGITDGSLGITRGAKPTIAAPGVKIGAPTPQTDGTTPTTYLSGTSMATPIAAGVVAVLMQADSSYVSDPAGVRSAVESYSRALPNVGVTECGNGIVSADLLVNSTEPDTAQSSARNPKAVQRDVGNKILSGSFIDRWLIPREAQ